LNPGADRRQPPVVVRSPAAWVVTESTGVKANGAFVSWERHTDQPMLDVRLFGNPRFAAASASVAISFFALSGFIFLVTQYFQFFKGYTPLSTGVRLLPVATCVAVFSVVGAKLAVRFGTKVVVGTGLLATAAFYLWVTSTTTATSSPTKRTRSRASFKSLEAHTGAAAMTSILLKSRPASLAPSRTNPRHQEIRSGSAN